jgi:hypothetical protein
MRQGAMDLKTQIASELCEAIKHLRGGMELLSIVGSYGDTLDDDEVLSQLRTWNTRHQVRLAPTN